MAQVDNFPMTTQRLAFSVLERRDNMRFLSGCALLGGHHIAERVVSQCPGLRCATTRAPLPRMVRLSIREKGCRPVDSGEATRAGPRMLASPLTGKAT